MLINRENLQNLYVGYSAAFREGFGAAGAEDHKPFTMEPPSTTRTSEYGWLGQSRSLRRWVGERVLHGIVAHAYSIPNVPYEDTIEVDRDDIADDNVGVYTPVFQEQGRAAAAHPCELAFKALKEGHETLCYDGQYFFDTDHPDPNKAGGSSNWGGGSGNPWYLLDCSRMIKPIIFQRRQDYRMVRMDDEADESVFMRRKYRYGVDCRVGVGYGLWQLAYGSRQPLTADAFENGCVAMNNLQGEAGRPLGINATHLFVGPSNWKEGLEILNAERDANGATNVFRGAAALVKTPWLT